MMGREPFHIFGKLCKSRVILFTLSISVKFHKTKNSRLEKEENIPFDYCNGVPGFIFQPID